MTKVPPVFVSHGSVLLAVERSRGDELEAWARSLPSPRGILVVSAHWETQALTRGSTAAQPALIHDYEPELTARLQHVRYPAPGAPELAYELHQLGEVFVGADVRARELARAAGDDDALDGSIVGDHTELRAVTVVEPCSSRGSFVFSGLRSRLHARAATRIAKGTRRRAVFIVSTSVRL